MLNTTLENQLAVVAAAFRAYGSGTATEVIYAADLNVEITTGRAYGLRSTISALETMGLLRNVGKRKCEITGRMARVLTWNPDGEDYTVRPVQVELTDADVETLRTNPQAVAGRIVAEAERQRAGQARLRARRTEILALFAPRPHCD